MRRFLYFLVYLATAVAGIVLLIFNSQAAQEVRPVLHPLAIGTGVIFVIPGIYFLISSMRPKRDAAGFIISRPILSTAMGVVSLIWGILILCMPNGVFGSFNITLGVSIIIAGLTQLKWIITNRHRNSTSVWGYIIPILAVAIGVFLLLIQTDFQNPKQDLIVGCIISGITLIACAVNGFFSLRRRTEKLETNETNETSDDSTIAESHDGHKFYGISDTAEQSDISESPEISQSSKDPENSEPLVNTNIQYKDTEPRL